MALATVLIVGQDNLDLLRLTVESMRLHNRNLDFAVWYWDNDSQADVLAYANDACDRVFRKDGPLGHHHAEPLDRMVKLVETPWVFTVDNDVVFKDPVFYQMIEEIDHTPGAVAGGPAARRDMGTVNHFGRVLKGQPRVDPCCAAFRTPELAWMVDRVSFTPAEVTNLGKFYDTGGMIRAAFEGAGARVLDMPWVWERLDHYGAMTWAGLAPDGSPEKVAQAGRAARAAADLEALRAPLRADTEVVVARYKEDLTWTEHLKGFKVRVYDKGGDGRFESLPNVGREAHTYAHHVAERYDDLAAVTVFSQGDPFPHAPDFLEQVGVPTTHFRPIGRDRIASGRKGDPCHGGLPNADLFFRLTRRPMAEKVWFAPGAIFAAHRDCLRRYPRVWWRELTDHLAEASTQFYAPWTMERIWAELLARPGVPHRHHTVPGWFVGERLYSKIVRQTPDGGHVVEVGSWVGRSARYMATEILNSNKRIRFDVVDTFRGSDTDGDNTGKMAAAAANGSVRADFERNTADLAHAINIVESTSVAAAAGYPDRSLDAVFVDAAHDADSVEADVRAWLPKVKRGGRLCGDDADQYWPGVLTGLRRVLGDDYKISDGRIWSHRVRR